MFTKLVKNLPFNPSLISQLSFYHKRLQQEASIRRLGFVFIALTFLVQLFAVMSPPQASLAASPNDIVHGGFSSREQAVEHCLNSNEDFNQILAYYQVTCGSLAEAGTVTIDSTDFNLQLNSLGRISYGTTIANTGKPTDEYPVAINSTTLYMRNLWAWDSGASSTYKMLQVTNPNGQIIRVMFDCGNIVTVGKYTAPATQPTLNPQPTPASQITPSTSETGQQNPSLVLSKAVSNDTQKLNDANGTTAQPGDLLTYTLSVQNIGTGTAKNFVIQENIADVLEYASVADFHSAEVDANGMVRWPASTISAGHNLQQQLTVKVKDPLPQTPVSTSNKGSFDLTMTNVYGNTVNVKLPQSAVKRTEAITTTLPNTGPGTTLMIGFVMVAVIGYFFARNRLLAKELCLVKDEYAATGGF